MEPANASIYKKPLIVIVGVMVVVAVGYGVYYATIVVPRNKVLTDAKANKSAYYNSLLGNKPEALQTALASDIRSGKNDMLTKSDAYFVMHRYFDNGGNIYEIYDYVNNHPELAFLKEAENIYPAVFKQIADRSLPTVFTSRAQHAFLAYCETLDKYGYADVSSRATIANQYTDFAYYAEKLPGDFPTKDYPLLPLTDYKKNAIEKAILYATKSKDDVAEILDGTVTQNELPSRDMLVGLNQYASAIRYLEALGVTFSSPKTPEEIFAFATTFSDRYVPELSLFTSWVNASSLGILASSTDAQIQAALNPFMDYTLMHTTPTGILSKILRARAQTYVGVELYDKTNVVHIANKAPRFKTWLMANGWTDSDFK